MIWNSAKILFMFCINSNVEWAGLGRATNQLRNGGTMSFPLMSHVCPGFASFTIAAHALCRIWSGHSWQIIIYLLHSRPELLRNVARQLLYTINITDMTIMYRWFVYDMLKKRNEIENCSLRVHAILLFFFLYFPLCYEIRMWHVDFFFSFHLLIFLNNVSPSRKCICVW